MLRNRKGVGGWGGGGGGGVFQYLWYMYHDHYSVSLSPKPMRRLHCPLFFYFFLQFLPLDTPCARIGRPLFFVTVISSVSAVMLFVALITVILTDVLALGVSPFSRVQKQACSQ